MSLYHYDGTLGDKNVEIISKISKRLLDMQRKITKSAPGMAFSLITFIYLITYRDGGGTTLSRSLERWLGLIRGRLTF